MPYAITTTCCSDASCVAVCPVNCIHPTPDEPGFATAQTLHVDPRACIDCGACADACPVDAVRPLAALGDDPAGAAAANAAWYDAHPSPGAWDPPRFPRPLPTSAALRSVAVVGSGPAAGYTVQALLRTTDARITVLERSPVPGGLLRYGVAPDHPDTRRVGRGFEAAFRSPRVRLRLGVEVGRDVTPEQLRTEHAAVVYAVGAPADRRLGVPGEDLPGCLAATDLVGWYNGAPHAAALPVDLSSPRAVVVGTGNVALDVARILLAEPAALARTPIAPPALAALRRSRVREVVVVGRRGAEHAAYSPGELRAMRADPRLEVVVADGSGFDGAADPPPGARRLVLRFDRPVRAVLGTDRAEGVVLAAGDGTETVRAGLVLRAAGSRGRALPGLPFDPGSGTVPHDRGRVLDPATGTPVPGTYVVGWAKRGAHGGIGANRVDAQETVDALLEDAAAGRLAASRPARRLLPLSPLRRVTRTRG